MNIGRNYKIVTALGAAGAFATSPELSTTWGLVAAAVTGVAVLVGSEIGAAISAAMIPNSLRRKVGIRDINDFAGVAYAQQRFAQNPGANLDFIKWGLYGNIGLLAGAIGAYSLAKPAIETVLPHKTAQHAAATPSRPLVMISQEGSRLIAYVPKS